MVLIGNGGNRAVTAAAGNALTEACGKRISLCAKVQRTVTIVKHTLLHDQC